MELKLTKNQKMVIAKIITPYSQLSILMRSVTAVLNFKGNKNFKISNFLIQKLCCLGFNKVEYTSINIITHKL